MKKISAYLLFVLAVTGLVFGGTLIRTDIRLPIFSLGAQSHIFPVAASESHSMRLPQVMNGQAIQTIFGMGMVFTEPGGMNEMTRARNSWLRWGGVAWSLVEPVKGTRDWSSLAGIEIELMNARERGMEMIFIVSRTPSWAQKIPGYACGPIRESELPTFASFMYELVARYSQPPYSVRYWEIWNEPDIDPGLVAPDSGFGCWGDPSDPYYGGGYYAEMLKAIYPEVKRADPQAQVLLGGLVLDCDPRTAGLCLGVRGDLPPKFLEGVLRRNGANDGGNYFDGISFHAYDYYNPIGHYSNRNWNSYWNTTGPVVIPKARFIKEVLGNYGVTGKFLMNTESALICGGFEDPPGGPGCESDPSSAYEQTKLDYVTQVYTAAIAEGLLANVWYHIYGWRNSALLNADRSPRPAYQAFSTSRNILLDAAITQEITQYPQVRVYEFSNRQNRVWVVWSKDGNVYFVNLDSMPAEIHDALGNPVALSNPLRVGYTPLYLEWSP